MSAQTEQLRVPYGMSVHGEEEIAAVVDVLRTSTQMGKRVQEFEERVAVLFEKPHGIMVNSGSSALLLAAEILNLPSGSEVITPALTFSTTVSCLLKNNLVPAFVDVEEGTYCIDPDKVEEMVTARTRALCVPNLIGNIAPWSRLAEIAQRHDLKVIEDSADTLGGTLDGASSGRFSDISVTSFYGSHVINCAGNGGMLCVQDDEQARRARLLRSWGRTSSVFADSEAIENRFNLEVDGVTYDAKFVFEAIGYNFEPSELGAAFGLVQLQKLEDNIRAREQNFDAQLEFFRAYEKWFVLPKQTPGSRTGWLAFPLTVRREAPFTRRDLQVFLEERGIQTRVVFTGNVTRQPGFRDISKCEAHGGYPNADGVMEGGMLVACHHGLTPAMLAHVHDSFTEFASSYR
jgi:CDP-6-deoxy-D-xylo-4-hexulose-3-dehydrase